MIKIIEKYLIIYDLGNIWDILSAVGTIGAVILSLWLAKKESAIKLKFFVNFIKTIEEGGDGVKIIKDIDNLCIIPINYSNKPVSIRVEGIRNKPNFLDTINLIFTRIKKMNFKYINVIPIDIDQVFSNKIEFNTIQPYSQGKKEELSMEFLLDYVKNNLNSNRKLEVVYREITGKVFFVTLTIKE